MIPRPREVALLMARQIDPQDAPSDEEYIRTWVPEHRHQPEDPGPDCAACWMQSYDASVAQASRPSSS